MDTNIDYTGRIRKELDENKSILEGCADAVVSINDRGIIEFFNSAAEKLWGYNRQDVLGKNVSTLLPQEHASKHDTYVTNYVNSGVAKVMGIGREVEALHKDGKRIPVFLSLGEAVVDGHYLFTAFVKDLSELKEKEAKLEKYSADLVEISLLLTQRFPTLAAKLSAILDAGCKIFNLQLGIVSQIDRNKYKVLSCTLNKGINGGDILKLEETFCSRVLANEESVLLNNIGTDDDLNTHPAYMKYGTQSYIGTPIRIGTYYFGTLSFSSVLSRSSGFNQSEKEYIEILARGVAEAIESDLTQKEILRQKILFKSMFDHSPYGMIFSDKQGNILEINTALENLLGFEASELIGKDMCALIGHEENPDSLGLCFRRGQDIGLDPYEISMLKKDGKNVNVQLICAPVADTDENVIGNLVMLEDISERKIIENELRKLSVVASNTDNAIAISSPDGRIEWVNQGFQKLTGYKMSEVIGKKPGDLLQGPETSKETVAEIGMRLKNHQPVDTEILNYSKSGKKYWIKMTINPVFDSTGKLINYIAVNSDISEQKQFQQELIEAKRKAEESTRAKEMFLANMSHEIRTPMNAILGVTEFLSKTELSDNQKKYVQTIEKSSNHLIGLINEILDFSKINTEEFELEKKSFALSEVFDAVRNLTYPKAIEKNLNLEFSFSGISDNTFVMGDQVRLSQVLINLINNAIKFTERGSVELKVFKLGLHKESYKLRFEVHDTGIGIPREKQEKIFKSFQQADSGTTRLYGGTGLGLAIAKKIIELHGGIIGLESAVGEGSVFYFELLYPKGTATTHVTEKVDAIVHRDALKGLRVLLAEDMEFNRFVIETHAEEWGCELVAVQDGKMAVDEVMSSAFDLILMDIQMPVLGGVEAVRIIRQLKNNPNQNIPIIALTANVVKGVEQEYLDAGMDDYVSKPFTGDTLLRKILNLTQGEVLTIESNSDSYQVSEKEIDLSNLEQLARGDKKFIVKMILSFIEQSENAFAEIKQALSTKDVDLVARIIHRIKPSFNIMGLKALHEKVLDIEKKAQSKAEIDVLKAIIADCENHFQQVADLLKLEAEKYE